MSPKEGESDNIKRKHESVVKKNHTNKTVPENAFEANLNIREVIIDFNVDVLLTSAFNDSNFVIKALFSDMPFYCSDTLAQKQVRFEYSSVCVYKLMVGRVCVCVFI